MSDPETQGARPPLESTLRRRIVPLAVLTLAAVLRFRGLGRWWLNPDEGIYFSIVTRESFAGFWTEVTANAHPPLFYLILRGIGYLTWDYLALRVFSALCGLAAVIAIGAATRELVLSTANRPTDDDSGEPTPALMRRAEWTGLLAAALVAVAPGAVLLSQVVRPYMFQLALLGGASAFLLRYRRRPHGPALFAYVASMAMALLTHYSSVLALGAMAGVVAWDGLTGGFRRPAWRRLVMAHAVPAAVVAWLFVAHVRALSGTQLADDALNGWLSYYMIDSVSGAWLNLLGYNTIIALEWLRGPMLVLLCALPVVAVALRRPEPALLGVGALAISVLAAALGVYPLGATRHSAWLMSLTIPAVAWLVGTLVSLRGRRGAGAVVVLGLLLLFGGPVGDLLGKDRAPWAPSEHLLTRADMVRMIDVIDPQEGPELILLSEQSFYLFVPFYPHEREAAVRSPDGTVYTFPYGDRHVLVSSAWDLRADSATNDPAHIARVLAVADRAFPHLELGSRSTASLLVGGWIPPFLGQLASPPLPEPVVREAEFVPSLVAIELDLDAIRRVFPNAAGDG